jgi:hypothetical protein
MNRITIKNKIPLVITCLLMCLLSGAHVMARDHDRGGFHGGSFHGGGYHGWGFHDRGWGRGFYHGPFWGGFYLGSSWFWGPTIVVEDVPYYYYGGEYYTTRDGETFVAATPPPAKPTVTPAPKTPAAAPASAPAKVEEKTTQEPGDTVSINVPNASGGYTPVKLIKKDNGYVGPQGEYYKGNPTVAELKTLYGK